MSRCGTLVLFGALTACGPQTVTIYGTRGGDGGSDASVAAPGPCADAGVPPSTLECTGLYADFAAKSVAPGVRAYAPAVPLWSDGAEKQRWIALPPGTRIDASNPNEWVFPVGTKLFKQFSYEGKRVETRMFQKVSKNLWVRATYAWDATESSTRISYGEDVPGGDGGTWVIPTPQNCDQCHEGRLDRILGFEQVDLGLAGATGLTLAQLAAEGLVEPAPARSTLSIGDDGTGLAAPALAWLHVNCGVTCHNANESAQVYGAGMRLRLDPSWLDGSPASPTWDPLRTTIGVPCTSGSVAGQPRISPGDPSSSVIVQAIGNRGGGLQMPPAPLSRFVDTTDVATVTQWVRLMPHGTPDAGPPDAGPQDAGPPDAGPDGPADAAYDVVVESGDATTVAEGGPSTDGGADAADAGTLDDATSEPDATFDADAGAD